VLRAIALALLLAGAASASAMDACQSARRKVEREQRSLAALDDTIAREREARQACQSRTVCARHDAAIADGEKRGARMASRIARYEAEASRACN
jgi:hypothetical protein